ncbi:class I SAM-dependent methyltransferase [Leptospira mayottensis]|uniref:Methyltransferase, UbiE/COQ5 family n=2 Tax=Leptospira mayottensis TaxID=1137606 RepID=A0AA87SXJ4_9LEPT|nr:class I SAM-dependent methyltransferase [Leptospira mayottensis]AXR65038.1 class I SAM-dependent methyltransferase [Leptospira mayottensis]EKS00276.1 methyltransferase, UbiE/COQ5 family [Leptospira mayottensis 200901122]
MESILRLLNLSRDGIYSAEIPSSEQEAELKMRSEVASKEYSDYYEVISKNHSIPVMDREIKKFLKKIKHNGIILDIGGCWGWHWRNIPKERPDVKVVVIDFLRENLNHAKIFLGNSIGKHVYLVHADATSLPFQDQIFDGVWTVQTFQHIPDFKKACNEAFRVLKKKGTFINYSLSSTPMNRIVYFLLRKKFHQEGKLEGSFFLNRASVTQKKILVDLYGKQNVMEGYSECFFHPDLRLTFSGRKNNFFGILDYYYSKIYWFNLLLARQKSFIATRR